MDLSLPTTKRQNAINLSVRVPESSASFMFSLLIADRLLAEKDERDYEAAANALFDAKLKPKKAPPRKKSAAGKQ